MWEIDLKEVPFEADVRELLMAFYPDGADVRVHGHKEKDCYHVTVDFANDEAGGTFSFPASGDRFAEKCDIKRELYKVLSQHEGRTLPWGTLTGIRPTKLAMQGIDFKKVFLTSDEKIKLCFDTAAREQKVLEKTDFENGWSLYVGIPFCPTRCLYCSFTAYPIALWKNKKKNYIDALCREIEEVSKIMSGKKLQTIYMGGGTPTSLEADELRHILMKIRECNDMDGVLEFTVEAGRPDSITEDKLKALRECGVSRISVNPQTMNQKTLDLIGRRHTVGEVAEKFRLARLLGFDNINMDIIVGLPGESIEDVEHTMDELENLGPDDITVHSLALKRAARLSEEKDRYESASPDAVSRMIELTKERCERMNLKPYYMYRQKNMAGNFENVGYAHEGKEGIYNILIMEEKQIIVGCGAGTTTKIPIDGGLGGVKRIENVKDPQVYIERIDEMIARKREINNGTY
ncbi:MAG: coproporphyrinogen dehydrogenase HemZ [Lachnospiraceae bacterium]|nr:coproporphyrinogen dehydrogenase HemZ [Lachnospiraceae bacterium]